MNRIPIEWEEISKFTQRSKVYGGWIVKYHFVFLGVAESYSWFVPDHNHVWTVE